MKIFPKSKVTVKKSAGAKKADKKYKKLGFSDSERKRFYKVKVKATDPQARSGSFSSVKMKEITEKRAEKLRSKAPRKDVENSGRMAQHVTKTTGLTNMERYKGSKIASGKSNLNLKGKAISVVAGKKKVGEMEARKPGNQYEKGTAGKQMYVGTKKPDPPKIAPLKRKAIKTGSDYDMKYKGEITPIQTGARVEEDVVKKPTVAKKTSTSSGVKKPSTGTGVKIGATAKKASSKKYYVSINGKEKQITEEESKGRYKNFFNK